MDLGKLYEAMARDGQKSSRRTSTDEKNTSSSGSSNAPVGIISHRQFHGSVVSSVAQKTRV